MARRSVTIIFISNLAPTSSLLCALKEAGCRDLSVGMYVENGVRTNRPCVHAYSNTVKTREAIHAVGVGLNTLTVTKYVHGKELYKHEPTDL